MTHEEEILETANRLKGIYLRHLQTSPRGRRTLSEQEQLITPWKRIAETVLKLKADPEAYMEAQFRYSPSTIFVSTLHGPVAQKRYKDFRKVASLVIPEEEREKVTDTALAEGEVKKRVKAHEDWLSRETGSSDMGEPVTRELVRKKSFAMDPLSVMLLQPYDPEWQETFGLQAAEELLESPRLLKAAEALGYDVRFILALKADYE